jgi:hypothetical protein
MHIIGIVGTAKNTGKTTTLAALIEEAGRRGDRIGVTGIGYDGEEIDTVTGLPKPRLLLQPGTIVATSEQCLRTSSAAYAVIKSTGTRTALGQVSIVEILTPGLMVLAGPNTKRLLAELAGELAGLGLTALFVDGSLNRIAAMSVVDSMVFTTGASRTTEIKFLSEEARAICRVFNGKNYDLGSGTGSITVLDRSGACVARAAMRSLFDADDASRIASFVSATAAAIVVPNMVSLQALEALTMLLASVARKDITIVVGDATIALLAGEPIAVTRWINTAAARGIKLGYVHAIRVAAMTVNPFYPLQHDHSFMPAYIDKDELLRSVREKVEVPVFNIKDDGAAAALYNTLRQ